MSIKPPKKRPVILSPKVLDGYVAEMLKGDCATVDIETDDSLDVIHNPTIVGISFYNEKIEGPLFVPISFNTFKNQMTVQALVKSIQPLFSAEHFTMIAHNAKFDIAILEHFGVKTNWGRIHCSQVLSFLQNENKRTGLKDRVFWEFNYRMKSLSDIQGKRNTKAFIPMVDLPADKITDYCSDDAYWCYWLYQKYKKELQQDKFLWNYYIKLEAPFVKVLKDIHKRGVHINKPFLEKLDRKVGKLKDKAEEDILKLARKPINVNSPAQLTRLLFKDLHLHRTLPNPEILATNSSGFAANAENLEILAGKHPIVDRILDYRMYAKLKTTYTTGLLERLGDGYKKIHCNFNQTVAVTGRLSSSDPNLQNIPSRSDLGKQVRLAFVPPKGHSFIVADYSNIELRILCHMSQDKTMLEKFSSNEDLHALTASFIFKRPLSECDKSTPEGKKRREAGKTLNFGIMYGMGPWALAKSLNISEEEAQRFIDEYFTLYRGVYEYIKKVQDFATKNGYVRTLFGRKRRLPEAQLLDGFFKKERQRALRQAVNSIIQGTQAEIIKLAMIKLQKRCKKAKLRLQVHDELVASVPTTDAQEVAKVFKECMMFPTDDDKRQILSIPMEVDLVIVDSWGKAK
jgi:DNA polymerase-1